MFGIKLKKKLKYVIIGAGATGGVISSYLASANKDVTLITKYKDQEKRIKKNGLTLNCKIKGEIKTKIKIKTINNYKKKADVIFICVRTPDIPSAISFIKKIVKKETIVFLITNGFHVADFFEKEHNNINFAKSNFIGKCRYFDKESTKYYQYLDTILLDFNIDREKTKEDFIWQIYSDLNSTGIKTTYLNEKNFEEIEFNKIYKRLPSEASCLYFDTGNINQETTEIKQIYKKICNELLFFAKKLEINLFDDLTKKEINYPLFSQLVTDIKEKKCSEIYFFLFSIINFAKENEINLPILFSIAEKYKEYNHHSYYNKESTKK